LFEFSNSKYKMSYLKLILTLCLLNQNLVYAQQVFINEFMSANVSFMEDEDGDFSDWIEIYNGGDQKISLYNYGISDDDSDRFKWIFPDICIESNGFLLIFASGKDKRILPIFWETLIDWEDDWKYLAPANEPTQNWRTIDYNDSFWSTGPSGFGYGDNDDATNLASPNPFAPSPLSVCIRNTFSISDVNDIVSAVLHIDYDDGFVAYLNGIEIARGNMDYAGSFPAYNQFADSPHEAQLYQGGAFVEYQVDNIKSILQSGTNVLAIQVHNEQLYSSDLSLIPLFTLEMTAIPPNPRGASPHLLFPESARLHTNFKINTNGETLVLSNPLGEVLDRFEFGYIPPDISLGRQPDGNSSWYYFNDPSPAASNQSQGYQNFAPEPQFSQPGGFYEAPFLLELSSSSAEYVIHYTLDGSNPTDSSAIYSEPIYIDSTVVVRARTCGVSMLPGNIVTHTYFMDAHFSIPVISLSTDPENFWDDDIGIYVFGNDADTINYPYWGSNFWEDWERPLHIEYFEADGQLGFSIDAGVQIFGSWSRLYPQKSLAIFARGKYGYEAIEYQIFKDKPISEFQAIVLRNSGQDWGRTFFRDAMAQSLVQETTDVEIQAYQPAMVFINGEIWGIHNVREKMNEHYLASNRGVDPDNLDFIERDTMVIQGDTHHYANLLNYVASNDMSNSSNYEYVKTQMDVDNFINYTISLLYFANPDWPWNNVKCWREKTATGKWRWLLFDLDYCFHGGHLGPEANTFEEMRNQNTGTTLLFFKLLENDVHRNLVINRFADFFNYTFSPSRILQIINQFQAGIEPVMPFHIDRWKYTFEGPWWLGKSINSMDEWYSHIQVVNDFAERRADFMRQYIVDEFKLWDGGMGTITMNVSPPQSGTIKINSLIIEEFPWSGIYFGDVPIELMAIPESGYKFSGWLGVLPTDSSVVQFHIIDGLSITAFFETDSSSASTLVINEINYKSPSDLDTEDWIEFYNHGNAALNLSGWIFKDSENNHRYIFPANTNIAPGDYLVLCRDLTKFKQNFPNVINCLGNMDFGFSSDGELVRLYDDQGILIDSLTYENDDPWPDAANGNGATLELKAPQLDNSLPENWAASTIYGGTPGLPNSVLTTISPQTENIPQDYCLFQNYPNPFNSKTIIRFSLPQPQQVVIRIVNVLGEEVITLIDKSMPPGIHSLSWDGIDLTGKIVSSGLYFYQVRTISFSETKKMLFIQ